MWVQVSFQDNRKVMAKRSQRREKQELRNQLWGTAEGYSMLFKLLHSRVNDPEIAHKG